MKYCVVTLPGRKTITQTFRYDAHIHDVLVAEANKEKISLNALVSHLLERYIVFDRHADRVKVVHFGPPLVLALFNEISDKDLRKIGGLLGKSHPMNMLSALGMPFTSENAIRLVEEFLNIFSHWFEVHINKSKDVWRVDLRHGIGRKWSIYICEYICSLFNNIGFQTIEPATMNEHSVILQFKPPKEFER